MSIERVDTYGVAWTEGGEETVRLASLIEQRASERLPLKRTAADVLNALALAAPSSWFVRQAGDHPRTVTAADVWRRRFPSGLERLAEQRVEDMEDILIFSPSRNCMDLDEARARGIALSPDNEQSDTGPHFTNEQWAAFSEVPALQGEAGVVEWLRTQWVDRAPSSADLAEGPAAFVAVLASEARRLLGDPPASTVVQLVTSTEAREAEQAALYGRIRQQQRIVKAGSKWPGGLGRVQALLLQQYEERMRLDGATSAVAEENLADLWDLEKNTVHVYLTNARKGKTAKAMAGAPAG